MQRIECDGLQCWADGARFTTNTSSWSRRVIVLSMFGPRNAVRAAWARLSGKTRTYLRVGREEVQLLEDGEKYVTIQTQITRQMLHLVIMHPCVTHQYNPFAKQFAQIGPNPEVRYFTRLNRMCPIPFRPTWREALWKMGRENGLIKDLPGFGLPGFGIQANEDWAPVIKQGIETGELR